jgi:CubicO group peptidase (beta-lactamase class C family)
MYWCAGYGLAQQRLTEQAGEEFDALMRRWLLQPMGLQHSDFPLCRPGLEAVARGHDATGKAITGG